MSQKQSSRPIELLAPARDADTAIAAIRNGADAVYIGGPSHGARASACNSIDDIRRVVDYAHRFRARVYVTLNTLIYNDEITAVERLAADLYRIGVDALIVQDMALLRMDLPPIALHASTQCDTRTPEQVRRLVQAGFSQIVIARELSEAETAQMVQAAAPVSVEVFVHGSICVCYNGDCRASLLTTGRSANRGECAQVCRYAFDLVDADGRVLVADKHLLSLADMNRLPRLHSLLEAGVSSFKIEGRLKDTAYVQNVTAVYRRALDRIIEAPGSGLRRASYGAVELGFVPDPERSFNRTFTTYFSEGAPRPGVKMARMASIDTPKAVGQPVATVVRSKGGVIEAKLMHPLANGDGLGYFDRSGHLVGFRLNRVDGSRLYPASTVEPAPGTTLYRNYDKAMADTLSREPARRTIAVEMTLRKCGTDRIALDMSCERGCRVSVSATLQQPLQAARSPQLSTRRRALAKLGDTIYTLASLDDRLGELFVPAGALTDLRRRAVEGLDRAAAATYTFDYRREEARDLLTPRHLTFHANVANRLAARFYNDHGTETIEPAAECTAPDARGDVEVMCTRYCVRRELGRCLRTEAGRQWREPLTLRSGGHSFRLKFDCDRCSMRVLLLV